MIRSRGAEGDDTHGARAAAGRGPRAGRGRRSAMTAWRGRAAGPRRPGRAVAALLVLALGLLAAGAARAQPRAKAPVIGLLDAGQRPEGWAALRQQLRELGYVEGQNVAFEARFANGQFEQLPAMSQDLVHLNVAIIVTGGRVAAEAARDATRTIPIVMATGDDPVPGGLVASLARPGGNITGLTSLGAEVMGKRFQLLREVIPRMSRLAVLWHRDNPASATAVRQIEAATQPSKVSLQRLGVTTAAEFDGAFAAMTRERARALFVVSG